METRWMYKTSENLQELLEESKGTCVIPMGCIEKHGLHLPLGTDVIIASNIAYRASQMETVCVFPDFTFGDVPEGDAHMPLGSITVSVELQMALLEELCEQISRNGFKKIIIYNGHGGNGAWLSTFLRKIENRPHDYVLMVVNNDIERNAALRADAKGRAVTTIIKELAGILIEEGSGAIPELTPEDEQVIMKYFDEGCQGGHAGFNETAYIMGLVPEHARLDRLGVVSGLCKRVADKYAENGVKIASGGWRYNNPNAFHGTDPVGCSEGIGKVAVRMAAERAAKIFKFVKEDEDLLEWNRKTWDLD